ncbi:MAG: hypothetical protein V8T45_12860 [Oscillospiraceae bacterium]
MNSNMRRLLKECFEAPEPEKKREFIASLPSPDVSIMDFLLSQAAYIPKWIWSLSALIFVVALVGAGYLKKDMLWCVSACMPLLALAPVTESGRSQRWNMAELEMSSRFSLKSVLLARLGILGLADLLLFFLLLPLAWMNGGSSILETGVYMLCPYLLTVFLGLWISRRVHGQECAWVCGAVALGVSLGNTLMYQSIQGFYAPTGFRWWAAAFVLLSAGVAGQCYKTIKEKEAPVWNLG